MTPLPDVSLRDDVIVEEIDGECLVLDMRRNTYFGLDALGLFIWRQLEQGQQPEQVLTTLAQAYPEVPSARLREDLVGFLGALREAELLLDA